MTWISWLVLLMLVALAAVARAGAGDAPSFQEVYDLVKTHIQGAPPGAERAGVEGLLKQLKGRATLLSKGAAGAAASPLIAAASVLEDHFGCIRPGRVDQGVDQEFASALGKLSATNRLKGLVLDLRFAGGEDYAAAAALVNRFCTNEQALLDWGQGIVKSQPRSDALSLPLVVLVNQDTTGAAEAVAAMLRAADLGFLIGANTPGTARVPRDFTLKNGDTLRLATTPVKVGPSQQPSGPLRPDITVAVSSTDEQHYLQDAFRAPGAPAATNVLSATGEGRPARRPRINEAELVKLQRAGVDVDDLDEVSLRGRDPGRPVIQDPVLARGIDLLKGVVVMNRFRGN